MLNDVLARAEVGRRSIRLVPSAAAAKSVKEKFSASLEKRSISLFNKRRSFALIAVEVGDSSLVTTALRLSIAL